MSIEMEKANFINFDKVIDEFVSSCTERLYAAENKSSIILHGYMQ